MHDSWVYDAKGKKTLVKIKAGAAISTYGTKKINGKNYYSLASNQYVLATNVVGVKRTLRHNSFIYNDKGQRIKRYFLKKNKAVVTYGGAIKLGKSLYYIVDKNMYVKKANF